MTPALQEHIPVQMPKFAFHSMGKNQLNTWPHLSESEYLVELENKDHREISIDHRKICMNLTVYCGDMLSIVYKTEILFKICVISKDLIKLLCLIIAKTLSS